MIGYFVWMVGVAALAGAALSYRFWRTFALAVLGAAGVVFGAQFVARYGYIEQALPYLVALSGLGAILAAWFLRRNASSAPLFFVGAALLLGAVISEHDEFATGARDFFAIVAAPFIIFAALRASSRLAPIAAALGLFTLAALTPIFGFANEPVLDFVHEMETSYGAPPYALHAVVAVLFLGLALIGPRHVVTRVLMYALVAFGVSYLFWDAGFDLEDALGLKDSSFTAWTSLAYVLAAAGSATCLLIGRRKLFEAALTNAAGAPDIFISYKRDERPRVEEMVHALRALKFNVWFDARLASGKSFDDEINQQVRAAKAVLVCWSPGAIASDWVRAEATIGRERGVLAACLLETCELTPPFNLVHAEDLRNGGFTGANPAWAKLVDQLGSLLGRPGLGEYVMADADGARAWRAAHPNDPLSK